MDFHRILSKRAFIIARLSIPNTKTNPLVASLIYNNTNTIISEGIHEKYGENHAEVNAFKNDKNTVVEESPISMFVTLEPCNHYGKTPPCVNLIIDKKVQKVVIGKLDPNPMMSGKSLNILHEKGTATKVLEESEEMDDLIKHFKTNIEKKRPYIYLKMATDSNGVAGDKAKRLYITDMTAQFFSHKMRASVNAIMIGPNTAIDDDPELTNRYAGGGDPLRLVVDKEGRLPAKLKLFKDGKPVLYLSTKFREDLADIEQKVFSEQDFMELTPLLEYCCSTLNIGKLLVEGGPGLVTHFLNKNLWDELYHFKSPEALLTEQPVSFKHEISSPPEKIKLGKDDLFIFKNDQMLKKT